MDKEKKLTEEEIMTALECCGDDNSSCTKEHCPLWDTPACQVLLAREALALINHYKQEVLREREDGVRLFEMNVERIQRG
jgi:hypothetical protein